MSVSLNDNLSGVYTAKYAWSTSSGKPGSGWTNLATTGGTVSQYQQGTWYLHVEIEDTAGWSEYSYSGPYRYDTQTPVISVTPESRDWVFNSNISKQPVNVTVTITDDNTRSGSSGIDYSQYRWTNTTASPGNGWVNLPSKSGGTVTQTQEGVWYLHVRTEDIAGWTQQRCYGPYKIDLTDPTSSVNIPNQSWTNVPYNVVLSVTDPFITLGPTNPVNPSVLLNTTWNVENRSYYNYLPNPSSGNYISLQSNGNSIPINQNGAYKIIVNLKDGANNNAGTVYYPTNGVPDNQHDKYLYDEYPPYTPVFDSVDGVVKSITLDDNSTIQIFDYVADQNNKVQVTIGDDLSGLGSRPGQSNDYAWFAWSKSPNSLTEGAWSVLGGIGSNEIFNNPFSQQTNNVDIRTFNINVHSDSNHTVNGQENWDYLKEGLWYLHIKQKDRAGNVTSTINQEASDVISGASPGYFQRVDPQPVFINKIKNLRVTDICDPAWNHYFEDKAGNPTDLKTNGIRTNDMSIYCSKEYNVVKLGYKNIYKINVVGLDEVNDSINIQVKYHTLGQGTNIIHRNVDVYIPDENGDYVRIESSDYNSFARNIQINPITEPNYVRQINYEEISDISKQGVYQRDLAKDKYSTYEAEIFLPPTAKFVTNSEEPDFINETNIHDYKLLCTFEIDAVRDGTGNLDYTLKEDKWAENYVWFTGVNDYGKNRRTGLNLVNDGVNHGEVIWFNLQQTLMDDLKHNRTW